MIIRKTIILNCLGRKHKNGIMFEKHNYFEIEDFPYDFFIWFSEKILKNSKNNQTNLS